MSRKLTHLDDAGRAKMVDVGHKPVTAREAVAEGFVLLQPATLRAIADETVPKGEVLGTARIAARTGPLAWNVHSRHPRSARMA